MRQPLGSALASIVSLARRFERRSRALVFLLTLSACAGSADVSKESIAADPLDRVQPEQLYREGERLALQGDPIRAEQYLSTAIQRGYPAGLAMPLLLRVCVVSSRLGAALKYATPYLRLHPDDYHLRYLVAAVQLGLGRPNEARTELERVLLRAPDHADAHYLLGVVLRDHLGDTGGAVEQFALHQKYAPQGLHGAEVAAWLHEHATRTAANAAINVEPGSPGAGLEHQEHQEHQPPVRLSSEPAAADASAVPTPDPAVRAP
jgi:tetratricopeptide (TPR) repeat protein